MAMTSRVKGPNRPSGTDGAPPIDEAAEADAVSAPADVAGSGAIDSLDAAEAVQPSGPLDPPGEVAARLKAGEITVDEAIELLIDDAIERQVAAATQASPQLRDRLRETLRRYAAADPHLAERIRRLHLLKP